MNSPLVVEIAYIGNKPYKEDNICKTGAVWFGHGDVQKIERKYVPMLLKHPDVWMLKTEFEAKFGKPNLIAATINPPAVRPVEWNGGLISAAQIVPQVAAENTSTPAAEIGARHPDNTPNITVAQSVEVHTSDDSGITKDSDDEPVGGTANESANTESGVPVASIEEIKGAIILLEADPTNKDWWTDIGRPKTDAVRNKIGKNVSVKDLNKAWSSMGRE